MYSTKSNLIKIFFNRFNFCFCDKIFILFKLRLLELQITNSICIFYFKAKTELTFMYIFNKLFKNKFFFKLFF